MLGRAEERGGGGGGGRGSREETLGRSTVSYGTPSSGTGTDLESRAEGATGRGGGTGGFGAAVGRWSAGTSSAFGVDAAGRVEGAGGRGAETEGRGGGEDRGEDRTSTTSGGTSDTRGGAGVRSRFGPLGSSFRGGRGGGKGTRPGAGRGSLAGFPGSAVASSVSTATPDSGGLGSLPSVGVGFEDDLPCGRGAAVCRVPPGLGGCVGALFRGERGASSAIVSAFTLSRLLPASYRFPGHARHSLFRSGAPRRRRSGLAEREHSTLG